MIQPYLQLNQIKVFEVFEEDCGMHVSTCHQLQIYRAEFHFMGRKRIQKRLGPLSYQFEIRMKNSKSTDMKKNW